MLMLCRRPNVIILWAHSHWHIGTNAYSLRMHDVNLVYCACILEMLCIYVHILRMHLGMHTVNIAHAYRTYCECTLGTLLGWKYCAYILRILCMKVLNIVHALWICTLWLHETVYIHFDTDYIPMTSVWLYETVYIHRLHFIPKWHRWRWQTDYFPPCTCTRGD